MLFLHVGIGDGWDGVNSHLHVLGGKCLHENNRRRRGGGDSPLDRERVFDGHYSSRSSP